MNVYYTCSCYRVYVVYVYSVCLLYAWVFLCLLYISALLLVFTKLLLLICIYRYPSTYIAYAGNPYALFALLYSDTFTEVIEHLDLLTSPSSLTPPEAGSVEDALLFQQGM